MTLATIEELLQSKIGLDAKVIGRNLISKTVEKRRIACNLPDLSSYLHQLTTSNQEFSNLIEEVIVPETWFFRDQEPFTFLQHYVTYKWLPSQKKHRILRLLSVPSSTGEEPYSIAMTLLNAGLTPNQFHIDAVDISKKSLLKAKQGIFSQNSFRGNKLEFREKYFAKKGDVFQLCDLVKGAVNFIHENIIHDDFLIDKTTYDAIFCRNVLIYFDSSAREKTIHNLERLLNDGGLLFVGHAETSQILRDSRFLTVQHPLAFAYYKKSENKDELSEEKSRINKQSYNNQSQLDKKNNSYQTLPIYQQVNHQQVNHQNSSQEITLLKSARSLADAGKLNEATSLCENYLKQHITSVEAYILLGQIYQSQSQQKQAEQCFQKAIYLDPNHYEALMHLALLKENSGEIKRAEVIRQRIKRLLIISNWD